MEVLKVLYQYRRNGVDYCTPNLITAGKRRDKDSLVYILEKDGTKVELTLIEKKKKKMKLRGNFKLSEVKKIKIKNTLYNITHSLKETVIDIEEDSIVEFNFKEEGELLEIKIRKK